jgi:hypothetical protein
LKAIREGHRAVAEAQRIRAGLQRIKSLANLPAQQVKLVRFSNP